jgi:excinuclease ABC subunit C
MASQIAKIKTLVTASETDALLLEADLIRKYQPKYNSELKDGKSYLRVKIKNGIIKTVHNDNDPEACYYGPYPDGGEIRHLLKSIRKYFPYATQVHKPGEICFRGHLGLCPCLTKTDNTKSIKKILSGKRTKLISDLKRQMKTYSKDQNFEEALRIRDQVELLTRLGLPSHQPWEYQTNPNLRNDLQRQKVSALCGLLKINYKNNFRIEGYDISHLSGTNVAGSMVVFIDGIKNPGEYRRFKIKIDQNDDALAISEILNRRFNHPEWPAPDLILVDGPPRKSDYPVIGLEKRRETIVLADGRKINLPKSNPAIQLLMAIRDEAHRFAQSYHRLLRKKKMIE